MRTIAVEVTPVPDADGTRLLENEKEVPVEFYQSGRFDVVVGADVGKRSHHLFAIDAASGEVLLDGDVANREADIRAALGGLAGRGSAAVVSDQPGPLSATLFACARSLGIAERFITPAAMHAVLRANDPDRKDDAWDARIIAETACGSPRLVKEPRGRNLQLAALLALRRIDSAEKAALMNRLHDRMLSESPSFEAAVSGLGLCSDLALMLMSRWGGPAALRRCGRANLRRAVLAVRGMGPASAARADAVFEAALEQGLPVEGAEQAEMVVRELAGRLAACRARLAARDAEIAGALAGEPAAAVLVSMPGVGPVTAATFLAEVGDASGFRSADALAHYAGLSPRRASSGGGPVSSSKSTSCNRRLRLAMLLAANSARQVAGSPSAAYYERRRRPDELGRREGHYHALLALARKMIGVMWAMLRDGATYDWRAPAA